MVGPGHARDRRLFLPSRHVSTFFGIKDLEEVHEFVAIDLRDNDLTTFEHFGSHPHLRELHLEGNHIVSLMGLTKQQSLEELNLARNPIARHPLYRVMALLTVGFSIRLIDGVPVESHERQVARRMGPTAALAVSYGWLLDTSPRSDDEYYRIIAQCRMGRKAQASGSTPLPQFRTITQALADEPYASRRSKRPSSGRTSSEPTMRGEEASGAEFLGRSEPRSDSHHRRSPSAADRDTVLRLSQRVAQLESELKTARELTQQLQQSERMRWKVDSGIGADVPGGSSTGETGAGHPVSPDMIMGLSSAEIDHVHSIEITKGIRVRSNLIIEGTSESRKLWPCCMSCGKAVLTVLHFFTRSKIAELSLAEIESVTPFVSTGTLIIQCTRGELFEFAFEAALTLCSVHKLLYLRRGLQPPLLRVDEATVAASTVTTCAKREAGNLEEPELPEATGSLPEARERANSLSHSPAAAQENSRRSSNAADTGKVGEARAVKTVLDPSPAVQCGEATTSAIVRSSVATSLLGADAVPSARRESTASNPAADPLANIDSTAVSGEPPITTAEPLFVASEPVATAPRELPSPLPDPPRKESLRENGTVASTSAVKRQSTARREFQNFLIESDSSTSSHVDPAPTASAPASLKPELPTSATKTDSRNRPKQQQQRTAPRALPPPPTVRAPSSATSKTRLAPPRSPSRRASEALRLSTPTSPSATKLAPPPPSAPPRRQLSASSRQLSPVIPSRVKGTPRSARSESRGGDGSEKSQRLSVPERAPPAVPARRVPPPPVAAPSPPKSTLSQSRFRAVLIDSDSDSDD